jgi:hypothetical protein
LYLYCICNVSVTGITDTLQIDYSYNTDAGDRVSTKKVFGPGVKGEKDFFERSMIREKLPFQKMERQLIKGKIRHRLFDRWRKIQLVKR